MRLFTKTLLVSLTFILTLNFCLGQKDTFCINESIILSPQTSNQSKVIPNDSIFLDKMTNDQALSISSNDRALDIFVFNDTLYTFIVNRNSFSISRRIYDLDFNLIEHYNFGNISNVLTKSNDINIIQDTSGLFLFVHDGQSKELEIFEFVNGIKSDPIHKKTIPVASDFTKIDFLQENGNTHLFLSSNTSSSQNIHHINFNDNIQNSISNDSYILKTFPVDSDLNNSTDIRVIKKDNNIYLFTCTAKKKVIVSTLDTNLNFISNTLINYPFNTDLRSIELFPTDSSIICYIGALTNKTFRLDFIDTNNYSVFDDFTNYNGSVYLDQKILFYKENLYLFLLDAAKKKIITHNLNPFQESSLSQTQSLSLLSYTSPGTKNILLINETEKNHFSVTSKMVFINNSSPPTITFNTFGNCLSAFNEFIPNIDSSINVWNWQFGDGDSSSLKTPLHQYRNTGTYNVTLSVIDSNQCRNTISDSINIFDKPIPNFSFNSPICTNNNVEFTNISTGETGDIVQWKWYEDTLEVDTLKEYQNTFTNQDTIQVSLTAEIPGCKDSISKEVIIIEGPQPSLSFEEQCLHDSTTFTNTSTGERITGYKWFFGNGDSSTLTSPTILYDTAKTFNIALTVTSQDGCNNLLDTTYEIHPLPQIEFENGLSCSSDSTEFYNRTSINSDSINTYTWKLNNKEVSSLKDPLIYVSDSGTYFIKLISKSNFGCSDSLTQAFITTKSPTVDIKSKEDCFGKPTEFNDLSLDVANITKRKWSIKDQTASSVSSTFKHTFESVDTFTVYLEVTSSTGCKNIDSLNISIAPLPNPTFTTSQLCQNDSISFFNTSTLIPGDSIEKIRWFFESAGFEEGDSVKVKFSNSGIENIIMELVTENGCTNNTSTNITIEQGSNAEFTIDKSIGTAPLNFNTTSSFPTDIHKWIIGGIDTIKAQDIAYTLDSNNTYEILHITQNNKGCFDTVTKSVFVGDFLFDLSLESLGIKDSSGTSFITVQILNNSPIPVSSPSFQVDFNNQVEFNSIINKTLNANSSTTLDIPIGLSSENVKSSNYICVALDTINISDFDDSNNSMCLTLEDEIDISFPTPNPASDLIYQDVYSSSEQIVSISLISEDGKIIKQYEHFLTVGNNRISNNISQLNKGIYLIDIKSNQIHQKFSFTKL